MLTLLKEVKKFWTPARGGRKIRVILKGVKKAQPPTKVIKNTPLLHLIHKNLDMVKVSKSLK